MAKRRHLWMLLTCLFAAATALLGASLLWCRITAAMSLDVAAVGSAAIGHRYAEEFGRHGQWPPPGAISTIRGGPWFVRTQSPPQSTSPMSKTLVRVDTFRLDAQSSTQIDVYLYSDGDMLFDFRP